MDDNAESCPHCGANLQGDPIPEESQGLFGATHFSRKIGVEIRGVYDGVHHWRCPDCGGEWERTGVLKSGFRTFNVEIYDRKD